MLVTGAAGFLGSFLCDRLLKQGHEVIGMDNRVSGQSSNLDDAFAHEQFSFFEHDVTEFIHVSGELDAVLHLASLASPVFYRDYPIKTLKVGALGTHKTLGLAREKDATYLFTSTSEVYGDPEVNPQPESYRGNVLKIRTDHDPVMMNRNDMVKRWFEGIETNTILTFESHGFSIHMDHGCGLMMGESFRIS